MAIIKVSAALAIRVPHTEPHLCSGRTDDYTLTLSMPIARS